MKTLEEAIADVSMTVRAQEYPAIPNDDLTRLVVTSSRASAYGAGSAYAFGAAVFVLSNGRMYRAVEGGQAGASAPTWPSGRTAYRGQAVNDGAIVWCDDGAMYTEQYDIRGAIRAAFLLKAAAVAAQVDMSSGNEKANLSQRHEHFIAQANRYGRLYVI